MSLWKALNTAVAALKRAWPPQQQVKIDLHPIPVVIERQSLALRQLLYTLVLEAVGNAIKHGGPAPYINIDLNWADNQVYLQIIDHGQGFDRLNVPFSEYGLGFWQMYVCDYLSGEFGVSSQPGFGTVVTATIPVIPARTDHYAE
jgi:signal transduction histidine kinase